MTAIDPNLPAPPTPEGAAGDAAQPPARPSLRMVGLWLVLLGVAIALDGLVGGLVLVFVAAVLLAGIKPRILGAVGVALLVAAPISIVIAGVPTSEEVSPEFVVRSLVPHHLTFAGLVLVSAFALIDLGPHLKAWASLPRAAQDDGPPLGSLLGVLVTALVLVAAVLACAAVLQA